MKLLLNSCSNHYYYKKVKVLTDIEMQKNFLGIKLKIQIFAKINVLGGFTTSLTRFEYALQ